MDFQLISDYSPTGDQPQAIKELTNGIENKEKFQTLLGVTGSGKTFTVANVIQQVQRPTLVLSHNKTLAAQLYSEFKHFFPHNAVEYFVSYYDYYQPEAYIPVTNTYIEKELSINSEIDRMRINTITSLISGRRDVIVVSSVSCIYGMGNPTDIMANIVSIQKGQKISKNRFLHLLVQALYSRSEEHLKHGQFRVKGDMVDVYTTNADIVYRIYFFGNEIEEIEVLDNVSLLKLNTTESTVFYPATIYVTTPESLQAGIRDIQDDLVQQINYFSKNGKELEKKRIEDRVTHDMEMMREVGYCQGIENYSRYFDKREPGERPFCLLDYFPKDYLLVADESHVTIPQIRAMYGGDKSRKINLVEYGFRLPAAMDNRPLMFDEFETLINQVLFVSATPAVYELEKCEGVYVEQVIRPTGLLDPVISIKPTANQIDDLLNEIQNCIQKEERVLVTTLTKRMAEELTKYLTKLNIRCSYIHSDVDTMERVEILGDLRLGKIDVLIGVNLLREGLDLPEVGLVAILDADKEGFLRSHRSLTQTIGRAARNVNGRAIFYADRITDSMQKTIEETAYRRSKQIKYNIDNNITPTAINKQQLSVFHKKDTEATPLKSNTHRNYYVEEDRISIAADPVVNYMNKEELTKNIAIVRQKMQQAAKQEDFGSAIHYRNELQALENLFKDKFSAL